MRSDLAMLGDFFLWEGVGSRNGIVGFRAMGYGYCFFGLGFREQGWAVQCGVLSICPKRLR